MKPFNIMLIMVLLVISTLCGLLLIDRHLQYEKQAVIFQQLSQEIITNKKKHQQDGFSLSFDEFYNANSDFVAWLSIAETTFSYPVMHTPLDGQYYLSRNFNKEDSIYGTPFLDAECFGDFSSKNSIIYGHYAQNHKMFGFLENYKLFPYYKEHPIVSIEIQSQLVEYDIFSVFVTSIDKNGFPYYNFIDFEENEDFSSYIKTVKSLSLYDTGIMPEYGDKLLTLSTCDYSKENGRLVIMAVAKTQ